MTTSWKWKKYRLETKLLAIDDDGEPIYLFRLTAGERTLFEGNSFRASPLHSQHPTDKLVKRSVNDLLGFLTLREGDIEQDYFDDYSAEQLEFIRSQDCLTISHNLTEDV